MTIFNHKLGKSIDVWKGYQQQPIIIPQQTTFIKDLNNQPFVITTTGDTVPSHTWEHQYQFEWQKQSFLPKPKITKIDPAEFITFCESEGIEVIRLQNRDSYLIVFPDGKVVELDGILIVNTGEYSISEIIELLYNSATF